MEALAVFGKRLWKIGLVEGPKETTDYDPGKTMV